MRQDAPHEAHQVRTSGRRKRTLNTHQVVLLVIAAAAPLAAMVGNVPLALARGNGAGFPAAMAIATAVLLCFAVGYSAMSQRVINTGAFYTYVARGLGRIPGVSAAYVAVVAYTALACGLAGGFGYFTDLVLRSAGIVLPWSLYSAVAIGVVGLLGFRSADLSAKVLGTLVVAEFAILVVFDLAGIAHHGGGAFPTSAFAPSNVLSGSLGIGLMFAFVSFVGFESAALYGEESRDPIRSIPRATYLALLASGGFYLFTSWIVVGVGGASRVAADAAAQQGGYVFGLISREGGEFVYGLAAVFLCTSVLASLLALHNAAARYLFALGRERLMPEPLARYHPRHQSPHVASMLVTATEIVVVGAFALAGAEPYGTLAASLIGLGTVGVLTLQAAAAVSVVVFFRGRRDRRLWATTVAPAIGAAGLLTALVQVVTHFSTLTGSDDPVIQLLPLLLAAVAVAGIGVGAWLRRHRPAVYAGIAPSELRRRTAIAHARITYTRRYCLVGGGPAGLVAARALLAEEVPFDWFERHTDVGGIWDADNLGSPMYESAHFISSRYTSGFYGFPMSEELPDYPAWWQIRDYIRAFAREYGLYDHVTLGVGVQQAVKREDGTWDVRLSTGEQRHYAGVIVAPGVTWHPNRPRLPGEDVFTGEVQHSVTFRDGLEFRGKRVLVVGAGNSGVDIACDAARPADQAFLSVRRGYRYIPKHLFGLPTDAVLNGVLEPPKGVVVPANPNQLIDSIVGDLTRFGLPAPDHDLLTSHPIMNTQVIHYLAHGDLIARPDVDHLTAKEVVFTDGSRERIDVVLLATGYRYDVPCLDPALLTWNEGHPQLYLNVFSREHDSLYLLGMIEFADAAYQRFDEMAQLVVMDIRARETGEHRDHLRLLKATDHPDLRGGTAYLDSPRHANYVESHAYQQRLAELRDAVDWPDLGERSYDRLRRHAATLTGTGR